MPASRPTMGSDQARPGRSGDDTGTDEGGEGAEFASGETVDGTTEVTDEDLAARGREHRDGAAEEGADEAG